MAAEIRDNLAGYFRGVGAKVLARVEVDQTRSNQHELNGTDPLKAFLGTERLDRIPAALFYLADNEDESLGCQGSLSWYDSRVDQPHRAPEFRLYYPSNPVMEAAREGDLAIVGQRHDATLLVVVAPGGSTTAAQLEWLFGVRPVRRRKAEARDLTAESRLPDFGMGARMLLDSLGIETRALGEDAADGLIEQFVGQFPTTREFSAYARQTCPVPVSAVEEPDTTITTWLEHEEKLFRALERRIVSRRIENGFSDVDDFVSFSLSVHNRRKSRVGYALENHLQEVFVQQGVEFSRGQVTENRARPDFLFPSVADYQNPEFPDDRLTMLGVKTTCKDRWRQVLSEARRIPAKHLFTLEPGITRTQTDEMAANNLSLVVPRSLHETYGNEQQAVLLDLAEFLRLVRDRQTRSHGTIE